MTGRVLRRLLGLRLLAGLAVGAIALTACGSVDDAAEGPAAADEGALQIVTTVSPITSIVANVAGPGVEITGLVPEGVNSHTFEPPPSAARVLADADVVFINGLGLEDPTEALARANLDDGAEIVKLGDEILPEEAWIFDFSFPEEGGRPNPHLWTNPPLVKAYAAQGDPLDASGLTPATVPDDQNVAMTTLLRPLTEYDIVKGEPVWHDAPGIARLDALKLPPLQRDGRSEDGRISLSEWQSAFRATNTFPLPATQGSPAADVLAALNRWKPELDELESATRRPHTRFNRSNTQNSVHALLPQLARGKALSQILKLRCVARLAAGDGDGALSDIEFNERWARALASDPLLISQLVAIAIETLGTAMAWVPETGQIAQ